MQFNYVCEGPQSGSTAQLWDLLKLDVYDADVIEDKFFISRCIVFNYIIITKNAAIPLYFCNPHYGSFLE